MARFANGADDGYLLSSVDKKNYKGDRNGNDTVGSEGMERCPFLRNYKPTSFSFSSPAEFSVHVPGAKGPIFEDEPNFEMTFKLFHGPNGIVPLLGSRHVCNESVEPDQTVQFNPLSVKAATISLSSLGFGPGGFFGFNSFAKKLKKQKKSNKEMESNSEHESLSEKWLETGQCPIAKSYRVVNSVLPLVAKVFQPPPGVKLRCPQAVVTVRAALARTALVKNLRPQPLPAKMLAIALLGVVLNVPLGIWREHTKKFSLEWFVAVHAAVPFIAMLRKSVLMPKTAMAITLAASILGQTIGSRAEHLRLMRETTQSPTVTIEKSFTDLKDNSACASAEERFMQRLRQIMTPYIEPPSAAKAEVCF